MVLVQRAALEKASRIICGDWCRPGKHVPECQEFRDLAAAPAPSCAPVRTASQCSAQETELAALLAEVELELRHSRVFIGSREKMHPTGIELYEQLHAKVNAALDALR